MVGDRGRTFPLHFIKLTLSGLHLSLVKSVIGLCSQVHTCSSVIQEAGSACIIIKITRCTQLQKPNV